MTGVTRAEKLYKPSSAKEEARLVERETSTRHQCIICERVRAAKRGNRKEQDNGKALR